MSAVVSLRDRSPLAGSTSELVHARHMLWL